MKICIVGTGAVGGLMAARFSQGGHHVAVIDRGERLEAYRAHGLRLIERDGSERVTHPAEVAASPRELRGPYDLVVLGVKAHEIAEAAPDVPAIVGPRAVVLTVQNGIPWWYFHGHGGEHDGSTIRCLDPDGVIARNIDPGYLVGCVVYAAAEVERPGVVRHVEGVRFPVGELDGSDSPRVREIRDLFLGCDFKSRVLTDIRAEIWLKAMGSVSFNPISALTGATMVDICRHREGRELVRRMMEEAQEVSRRLGITMRRTIDERIAGAERVGAHKTSMLQDLEAGRRLELEALVLAIVELGRLVGVPTPHIESVHALASLLQDERLGSPSHRLGRHVE